MYKKITILIFTAIFIVSCGNDSNSGVKIKGGGISKNSEPEIKVEFKEGTLHIGDEVEIKNGTPSTLPEKFKIFKKSKTYTNSNVKDYLFHVNTNGTVKEIYEFYKVQLGELGYTQIIIKEPENLPVIEENNNLPEDDGLTPSEKNERLEFVLRNPEFKPFVEGELPSNEPELLDKVIININTNTPEAIKDGMDLEGVFTEVYYNQLF